MAGPEESNNRQGYVRIPHSYAVSGKIMLAAICVLFAVVVLIACLHVYSRCFLLRRRRRRVNWRRRRSAARLHLHVGIFGDNASDVSTLPDRGLDAKALRSLPVFVFSSKTHGEEGMECAVCLSEFEENEKGRLLPNCKHNFHIDCIDMWFLSHSTCPLCRASVRHEPSAPMSESPVEMVVPTETLVVSNAAASDDRHSDSCLTAHEDQKGSSSLSSSFQSGSSSSGDSRTAEGMRVEVPVRRGGSFGRMEESSLGSTSAGGVQGLKSPGGNGGFMSLKRIWSREGMLSPRGLCGSSPPPDIDLEVGGQTRIAAS